MVTVTTTAHLAGVIRKPLLVLAVLFLCFPAEGVLWMGLAATIGAALPVPRVLLAANAEGEYVDMVKERKSTTPAPMRFRAIGPVIRAAGLVSWTIAFAGLFVVVSFIVSVFEPAIGGFANSAWLMFQVVTTIGLGDFTCSSLVGRGAAIVLSVYSVFFLALVTGAVVSYCQERMAARRDESVARFIDQLEHLPELSRDELAELSEKVKRIDDRRR